MQQYARLVVQNATIRLGSVPLGRGLGYRRSQQSIGMHAPRRRCLARPCIVPCRRRVPPHCTTTVRSVLDGRGLASYSHTSVPRSVRGDSTVARHGRGCSRRGRYIHCRGESGHTCVATRVARSSRYERAANDYVVVVVVVVVIV